MFVSVEEFVKLQTKVDDIFKAIKSSHESCKGLRIKVKSIEENHKKLEEEKVNREDFDTLDEEIEKLQEERKENAAEIKDIETKLKNLQQNQNILNETTRELEKYRMTTSSLMDTLTTQISTMTGKRKDNDGSMFKCKQCDAGFIKRSNLQSHIELNHEKSILCKVCGDKFSKSHQLEDHMQRVHKHSKRFLCGECNMGFLMRWRLHKHLEVHKKEEKPRTCHFFNNNKKCPYENVGCKFLHEEAEGCRFEHLCNRTLCQYRHD